MQREQERGRAEALDGGVAVDAGVDAGASQRYTSEGQKPAVQPFADAGYKATASEIAYQPGLTEVTKLKDPSPRQIADVIEKHPTEMDAILAWVRDHRGPDESHDVAALLQERKGAANKPKIGPEGPQIGDYKIRPGPAGPPSSERDNRLEAEKLDIQRSEQNAHREREDEDPQYTKNAGELIDKKLHGAPPKSKRQQSAEQSITDSIESSKNRPDGGIPGIQKRYP